MRRPPGLWILLSAGVVWLSLQDVYGIRATSLIFGKTTTTTTTTTTTAAPEQAEASEEETVTTELNSDGNATKPTLTGNPQIDYIWDPNLPKELNGYNLSDYPFYERVPEDIDFKCDGLHDGFYASVTHKCQVYHHCLFGTRYDFLCANYTAFDQKTFICHFASEVDCAHSKNFWHRNDALYQAASTTTIKPFVIYTRPPQAAPVPPPVQPVASAPLNPTGPGLGRPMVGRRRPFRRRRPQFDYYEDDYYDYYEERPRSNRGRKRPRPRPRPLYDDEYEDDYEDDRYERRGGTRRDENRRPYERRPSAKRRNKDRVKQDYLDETDDRLEDEDYKSGGRRKPNDRKNFDDESDEDRYPESRKPNRRRPLNDRNEEDEKRPRRGQRRPVNDDYEDDAFQADDSIGYERPKKNEERRPRPKEEPKPIIKPVSGTIYDRPRVAPRIKLPVPKNEANKYAYKPVTSTETVPAVQDSEDYYEYYEEEPPSKRKFNTRRPLQESRNTRSKTREGPSKEASDDVRPRARKPDLLHETSNPKPTKSRPRPVSEEYYDDYEEYEDEEQSVGTASRNKGDNKEKSTTSTTTTTTTERTVEKVYHHCLFGTRYDFLCANYTAFDQTLFNCNFVSNVDCENSKKFWHRNDELYIEKSTTTAAPTVYNFYTVPPRAAPLTPSPAAPGAQLPAPLPPPEPLAPRRQPAMRQRPYQRPRPLYDYYEEDYEEMPRPKGRKRRPRPRPVYYDDDDYEDYEESRLPRRSGGRRRPYWRERTSRRKDRRKYDYDEDDYGYEYDDAFTSKSPKDKRKKLKDDYEDEDDRRDRYERRRPSTRRHDKSHKKGDKRILDDEYEYEDDIRPPRRNQKEVRDADRRRPYEKGDETRTNSRLGVRRPPSEDFEDDLQRADNSRLHDKRRQNKETSFIKPLDDGRPIVKPVSGTIYDRPRVAPRINLPVPKNAAEKYAYKSLTGKAPPTQSTPPSKVEEDEEEYDDEPPTKRSKLEKKNSSPGSTQQTNTKSKEAEKTESIPQTNPKPQSEEVYVEEPSIKQLKLEKKNSSPDTPQPTDVKYKEAGKVESTLQSNSKAKTDNQLLSTSAPGNSTSAPAISEEYDDYYDDVSPKMAVEKDSKTDSTATSTTKSKIEALADQPMPIIRKFKRPFLPSRGGNPFSARSLQPVGSKTSSRNETQRYKGAKNMEATASPDVTRREEIQEVTPDSRPIPMRVKSPMFAKSTTSTPAEVASSPITEEIKQSQLESEAKPGPIRIKVPIRVVPPVTEPKLKFKSYSNGHGGYPLIDATTTERTKLSQSDILNGNYDVTLNEAISPIIPKIPVRNYGGFNPTNDYTYKRIQRPTKFVILDPVVSDGPFYVK